MATWETPATKPTVAQTCRSFRQPPPPPPYISRRARHHAAASSIPIFQPHTIPPPPRGQQSDRHIRIQISHPPTAPSSRLIPIDRPCDSVSCRACAHSTSMAVAGGGVVLSLRGPSASASPAVGRLRRAASSPAVRCGATRERWPAAAPYGVLEEDHYRVLRLEPGASRGDVKKAFHRLALEYHPDVVRRQGGGGDGQENSIDFERINAAYQTVMRNMREAEATLEYWRHRYGLADEDLDRYRHYLNEDDEDDWFSDF